MNTRVVITGLGLVTPIGVGVTDFWHACLEGRSGVQQVRQTHGDGKPAVPIAGLVQDFQPADFIASVKFGRMDRFSHFALVASKFALEDAGLDLARVNPRKIGVVFGSCLGGMMVAEEQLQMLQAKGPKRIHPKLVPANTLNAAAGEVAIAFGLKGPNLTVSTPYVSGAAAVGLAYDMFQLYNLDILIAGGVDTPLGHLTSKSILETGLVSSTSVRPFDRDRDGFVLGEGGATLVLERIEHALGRRASIYAEYAGYGQTYSNASNDIAGLKRAAQVALDMGAVAPGDIDYIQANGMATKAGDLVETQAIKSFWGSRAFEIPISATKSMIGHTLGAAGAVEIAVCALVIRHGFIPPTINYTHPDPECDLDYVPNVLRKTSVRVALAHAFGLRGDNIVSILKHVSR